MGNCYRDLMKEALGWALTERDETRRERYLQIARVWFEAALAYERASGVVKDPKQEETLKRQLRLVI